MAGLIVLAGCSQKKSTGPVSTDKAVNVQAEQAAAYSGNITSRYSGVVEAQKTTALSFAGMGTVTEVLVEEGQSVSKGQLLGRINASTAQNSYQAALAGLQQAEDAYRRMKPMKENGTLPEIKWVEVETGVARAKAAVAIAQKSIADCNLYAPVSGVVGKKHIQPGMNVTPGSPAIDLLNIQSVYVKIPAPENEVNHFRKGAAAQIYIAAIDRTVTGTVKEIGVSADVLSHTYPVKIEVQNSEKSLKPGMICSVNTETRHHRTGILISNKALQEDVNGQQFVYTTKDNKAVKTPVQTVALIENKVLIRGNIPEGTPIIISGQQKLNDRSPVKIINN
ncbi:MAG: efflux RND transporter periplasmic adaptor subunit [Leadbetterella sp.]|nr:efflux RND transporter periplasmic adaptor subunit [Leadbetterella sp.]